MAEEVKPENILDIVAEAELVGPGDSSHLQVRVENMERQIVASPKAWIEPMDPVEQQAFDQQQERESQIAAAARGERPKAKTGEAPRISDFFLIDTTMAPEAFLAMVNKEVLGYYDVLGSPTYAEFGLIVFQHIQGLPQDGMALSANTTNYSPLAKVKPMLVVKLDMGPRSHYDTVSIALISSMVKAVGRRAWRCGWSVDREWSWVEHWRQDKHGGNGKMTETIDGPANAVVTSEAYARWGVNVRAAFDDLMRVAQWETLRQWLVIPEPRPSTFVGHVSFLAGKLLIAEKDHEWIIAGWNKFFPGRKPTDGPLHLQANYAVSSIEQPALGAPAAQPLLG